MKAPDITAAAHTLISGDRKAAYGDVVDGLTRVADIWNGILDAAGKSPAEPLNAQDVAQLMVGLKIARSYTGPFRADNFIDAAGWSAVAGEAAAHLAGEDIGASA